MSALVLGGHPRLGRLLDDLLADRVHAGVEQLDRARTGGPLLGPLPQLGEEFIECRHDSTSVPGPRRRGTGHTVQCPRTGPLLHGERVAVDALERSCP